MRTIVAISTPLLNCAIHIIRLSGPDTYEIINKVTKKKVHPTAYKIQHNYIIDDNHEIVDEVLINTFVKPNSYTGEDSVEINCHGGVVVAKKILNLLIINGAEQAANGEFSQQAFLNNKLNYQQLEGINSLIHANNELATKFAINSILGNNSAKIQKIRDEFFKLMGSIEVNIDYPEYDDVPEYSNQEIKQMLVDLQQQINMIIKQSKIIRPVFTGLIITIVGKPNAGKSSLLNCLTKEEKAIVHSQIGTTRDIVESQIIMNDIPLKILDTAGIHQSDDEIEQIGIKKSIEALTKADLIIYLIDPTQSINEEDDYLQKVINEAGVNYVKVYNKADLKQVKNEINISCKKQNLDELIAYLTTYLSWIHNIKNDELILQSDRQITLMEKINHFTQDVISELNQQITVDLIAHQLEEIIKLFNDILGISLSYDKLDELFKNFCIGK